MTAAKAPRAHPQERTLTLAPKKGVPTPPPLSSPSPRRSNSPSPHFLSPRSSPCLPLPSPGLSLSSCLPPCLLPLPRSSPPTLTPPSPSLHLASFSFSFSLVLNSPSPQSPATSPRLTVTLASSPSPAPPVPSSSPSPPPRAKASLPNPLPHSAHQVCTLILYSALVLMGVSFTLTRAPEPTPEPTPKPMRMPTPTPDVSSMYVATVSTCMLDAPCRVYAHATPMCLQDAYLQDDSVSVDSVTHLRRVKAPLGPRHTHATHAHTSEGSMCMRV
jgi:hypothetical protein